MNYNFSTLSPDDFEELTRDLVGRVLAIWLNACSFTMPQYGLAANL